MIHCSQLQLQEPRTHTLTLLKNAGIWKKKWICKKYLYLEYAVQFWSPHLHRHIDKIERVQIKTTKIIPEIRNHSYQQRHKDLELISLVQRRFWGQLIEVFKYLNRFNNVCLWHMPHGIDLRATPENSYSYCLLYEQLSPARIHAFTQLPFLLLQTTFRQ